MKERFKVVGAGGTFDEFHKGHRALIHKAFEVGEHVLIGLCTDEFAEKLRRNHDIAPYEERLNELRNFLERKGLLHRAQILPLKDPYGPSVTDGEIEALVVSRETEPRAYEINEIRKQRGLPPLKLVVIEMIPAEDSVSISTTRIHLREIDREGRLLRKRDI